MNRRTKKRYLRMIRVHLLRLLLVLILLFCCKGLFSLLITKHPTMEQHPDKISASITTHRESKTREGNDIPLLRLAQDELYSRNAILVRLSDQEVLYRKNSDAIIYPASLTKIMTAIVAIENLDDLKQSISLPKDIFPDLYNEDASMAGFLPGESVSAIDLLYGVLLPSGAECCLGLCDYISGSEDAFVDLMNRKAQELGMESTHFTNSTGLNDINHYTTVADLSILLEYALSNDTFREIFTSSAHSTSSTSLHPEGITFYSTMFKNMTSADFDDGSILGGKTGYTAEAGLCLASLAQKNGTEYILVTAGAEGSHATKQYNIKDAFLVYNSLK